MEESPVDVAADWGEEVCTDMKLYTSDSDEASDNDEFINKTKKAKGGPIPSPSRSKFFKPYLKVPTKQVKFGDDIDLEESQAYNEPDSVKAHEGTHSPRPVSSRVMSARMKHHTMQLQDKIEVRIQKWKKWK